MYAQKTAGFRYFRANLRLRLQVNAQPFNAGRLIMAWYPFYNSETYVPSNERHFGGVTGYRHVDLDLGESTSAELVIPYMSPLTHTDLITGFGEMGAAGCEVYSQLTGANDVEGTLWANFEDICLDMPTGMPPHIYTLTPQSGFKQEAKAGDLQTMMQSASNLSGKFAKIPVIGTVASSLQWFTGAMAGVASIFGWSKPTNPDIESPMTLRYARNYANYNGQTLSKPMGFDAQNAIVVPKGIFGTDDDEMVIANILKKPIFMNRFRWAIADTPGTSLFKWPVHPSSCITTEIPGDPPHRLQRDNTYLSFLADIFKFWRGGINYHFKFVKTNFHSGRVRIVFAPGAQFDTDIATIDVDKCYSQIVDVRENTSVDFTVPYVANRMFSDLQSKVNIPRFDVNRGVPTGMLYVFVLNTLRKTGDVADYLDVIIETSAAPDFQFAFPLRDNRSTIVESTVSALRLEPQAFFPSKDIQMYAPNAVSMGEAVVSLRQVLKRYCQISEKTTPDPVADEHFIMRPYTCSASDPTVTDMFSYISHIYRCMSGSLRIMFTPLKSSAIENPSVQFGVEPADSLLNPGSTYVTAPTNLTYSEGGPFAKFFNSEENLELDIPWYQVAPFLPTCVGNIETRDFDSTSSSKIPNNAGTQITFQPTGNYNVSRAIGEDFSFAYLIGPPRSIFQNTE